MQIIAFTGPKGVGKSTLAARFVQDKRIIRASFADPIRDIAARMGVGIKLGEDKEAPRSELGGKSYREALIDLGGLGRKWHEDWWLNMTRKTVDSYRWQGYALCIIDDLRYANELAWLELEDAWIFRISREGVAYTGQHITETQLLGVSDELAVDTDQGYNYLQGQIGKYLAWNGYAKSHV